jgi:nicotinamide riboside kinase
MPPITIFIIGPSSTGKTTLCSAIVRELHLSPSAYITEVAREVMRTTSFTRADVGKLAMQSAILAAQLGREDAALRPELGHEVVLSDRSGIDPVVYAILTSTNEKEKQERVRSLTETAAFKRALEVYRTSSFVFLLTPIPEWLVDDGIRSIDDREECAKVFRELLKDKNVPYVEIGSDVMDLGLRVRVVLERAGLNQSDH